MKAGVISPFSTGVEMDARDTNSPMISSALLVACHRKGKSLLGDFDALTGNGYSLSKPLLKCRHLLRVGPLTRLKW